MRAGIIGAGATGLSAAYYLGKAGHQVTVFERAPFLGGQASTFDVGGARLERGDRLPARGFGDATGGGWEEQRALTATMLEIAEEHNRVGEAKEAATEEWRALPVSERITHALVKGIDTYAEADAEELRAATQGPRRRPPR